MSIRQVVIIHGWSDDSDSFIPLAQFLKTHGFAVVPLWLGDYISMDDDVKIEDVAKRMDVLLREKIAANELSAEFDMIVHSTGGLVVRQWLSTYYSDPNTQIPVKRLLMLAPANFGSKLAATGQSALGRLVKGFNNWFHTGKEMLNALELASPFQWGLAQRDLFVPEGSAAQDVRSYYSEQNVWPFVLVGTHPYADFLRRIVNESGGDGTVRACAANLNIHGVTVDFSKDSANPNILRWVRRQGAQAFPCAILPDRTHASIITPESTDVKVTSKADSISVLSNLILQALNCATFAEYQTIVDSWEKISDDTASLAGGAGRAARLQHFGDDRDETYFHQYFQVVVRVVDDHGADVNDYFLEFYSPNLVGEEEMVYFHRSVLEDNVPNSLRRSQKALYVDRDDLVEGYYSMIQDPAKRVLGMSISATPPGKNVHYFSGGNQTAEGWVTVHRDPMQFGEAERFLKRNCTHFVKIIIPRDPNDDVFRIKKF